MRIAAISDIHYDNPMNKRAIDSLPPSFFSPEADILVIAGDMGEGVCNLEKLLKKFSKFKGMKGLVPGNHDLWKVNNADSMESYNRDIPSIASSSGFEYLPHGPIKAGDYAVVGDCGWCDFTYKLNVPKDVTPLKLEERTFVKKDEITQEDIESGMFPYLVNGRMIFNISDCVRKTSDSLDCKTFAEDNNKNLRRMISDVSSDKKIILVTHFVPDEKLTKYCQFGAAPYLGGKYLEGIMGTPNVIASIYGHQHNPGERDIGGKPYINVSFMAHKPKIKIIELN